MAIDLLCICVSRDLWNVRADHAVMEKFEPPANPFLPPAPLGLWGARPL